MAYITHESKKIPLKNKRQDLATNLVAISFFILILQIPHPIFWMKIFASILSNYIWAYIVLYLFELAIVCIEWHIVSNENFRSKKSILARIIYLAVALTTLASLAPNLLADILYALCFLRPTINDLVFASAAIAKIPEIAFLLFAQCYIGYLCFRR